MAECIIIDVIWCVFSLLEENVPITFSRIGFYSPCSCYRMTPLRPSMRSAIKRCFAAEVWIEAVVGRGERADGIGGHGKRKGTQRGRKTATQLQRLPLESSCFEAVCKRERGEGGEDAFVLLSPCTLQVIFYPVSITAAGKGLGRLYDECPQW